MTVLNGKSSNFASSINANKKTYNIMTRKITLFIAALFLCGAMQAQNYHWSYNYHDYESNFPLIGEVYINGEVVASSDFEIAAFVGDQVRATEFLFEADPVNYPGHYFAWLGVAYNNAGETVTFRMYDHATGTEYTDCSTTVLTNANGYGEMWDPVNIYFTAATPISYGPDYPWEVSGGFENYMYLEAQIQINGVPVTNTNWEVGAFCGDECRGLGDADNWWVSPVDQSNILEIVVGGATGDVINFYLYDVTDQEVYPAICDVTLDWVDDDIGDMFEPFVLNFVTMQTFTKEISAYTSDRDNYYLIASPIGEVAPSDVTNMLSNSFDLYYFDQAQEKEWITYKEGEGATDANFNLVSGKGYLYANSQDVTLSFTGFPYTGNGEFPLEYTDGCNFSGWNLVGNPFAKTAYIDGEYYVMGEGGMNVIAATNPNEGIPAMEGCFVVATAPEQTVKFLTTAPNTTKATLALNLINGRNVVDRAIVRFGEGQQLPKFQLNSNSSKLYMPIEGNDYAVVYSGNVGEVFVGFKAAVNGNYTLVLNTENVTFNYLHLIDNLTGADVDLLQNPSYSFNARTTDYESRFKLVFATGVNNDDVFGFYSNGNWIINNDGDAILQVVDVTGRIMSNEEIHGSFSKRIEAAPGVYMLRLVKGNDVKVQKIVVE